MTIRKRDKLPEVEKNTSYFIPRVPSTFDKVFPEIESIRLEAELHGEGVNKYNQTAVMTEKHFERFLPCHNPLCYGGGIDLQRFVSYLVAGRKTEEEDTLFCQGHEGSPKGRKNYGPCDTYYKVKANLSYKPKPDSSS